MTEPNQISTKVTDSIQAVLGRMCSRVSVYVYAAFSLSFTPSLTHALSFSHTICTPYAHTISHTHNTYSYENHSLTSVLSLSLSLSLSLKTSLSISFSFSKKWIGNVFKVDSIMCF